MNVLKHEAKKIGSFSKVKIPISAFNSGLCNNSSVKEKYTLGLWKKIEVTGFCVMQCTSEILLVSDTVFSNGFDCN